MCGELKELIRRTAENTLNALLEEGADDFIGTDRCERTVKRKAYHPGHGNVQFFAHFDSSIV